MVFTHKGDGMSFSIGLYFDISTETKIRSIWKEMAEKGISHYLHESANRPHFTFAIFTDIDIPNASKKLAEIASEYQPVCISFPYIGCFPSLRPDLFLGPTVTQELLDFHNIVNQRFTGVGHYPDFDYYLPGHWVPHCALAMEMDFQNVNAGIDVARSRLDLPLMAQIEEIGLIEFRPVKHLFSYRIGVKPSSTSFWEQAV
jgi:hypothetical protein